MGFFGKKKDKLFGVTVPTILVLAVKGGTGKTVVARELIMELSKEKVVAALDADVDSPNLAESLGVPPGCWMELTLDERNFVPVEHGENVRLFSTSLYHPDAARGWTQTGNQNQLLLKDAATHTEWGQVDMFVVDMPAGSSDEFRAITQWFKNILGVVVVTQPNTIADLGRAFDITSRFCLPILGVVENMVEVECQKCGHSNILFADHGLVKEMCDGAGVRYMGFVGWVKKLQKAPENSKPLLPEKYRGVIEDLVEVIQNG